MDKSKHIDIQTPDGAGLNLDALYKIALSCLIDAFGDDGEVHLVVDFNNLRLLLGDRARFPLIKDGYLESGEIIRQ